MSKENDAKVTINLSAPGNFFLIRYQYQFTELTLEEVLDMSAEDLPRTDWDKWQIADMIVIGTSSRNGKKYILNNPSEFALARLQERYERREIPTVKRINNSDIMEITVYNMMLDEADSKVLHGVVFGARSRNGYIHIFPETLEVSGRELKALMNVLMELRMFRLETRNLQWIRNKYR